MEEEFFEASNVSENEYYDANYDTFKLRDDEIQYSNTFKHSRINDNENVSTSRKTLENEILGLIDPTELNLESLLHDKVENFDEIDGKNEDEETKNSAVILEAILNEESLKRIYFEEKCISKDTVNCNAGTENKMNLWSFINNSSKNRVEETWIDQNQGSQEGDKLNCIDKEVEELELEIERMLNSGSIQKIKIEPTSSHEKYNSEDTDSNIFSPIPNKRKISAVPAFFDDTSKSINQTSSISAFTHSGTGFKECNFNDTCLSMSIPSMSTLNQDSPSVICNHSETEFSTESEEIVTLMETDPTAVLPVHSVEMIPKFLSKQSKNYTKKLNMERNLKTPTLENNANQNEADKFRQKRSKAKSSQDFKKVRSLVVSTQGSKKGQRNSSKSFHLEKSNHQKITNADNSRSCDKKLKPKDSKQKDKFIEPKRENRGINTRRVTKRNFSCQKVGAYIDSKNFCSISMILESAHTNTSKRGLMNSLKDYFWRTESNKEKALLQLVILSMTNNFEEISIKNDKFRLYCQNEFSTNSVPKNSTEEVEDIEGSFRSNLICQPLYIETITSRSQVNRLGLEMKNLNTF